MNAFIRNELSCSSITKLTKGVIVAYVRFQFVHTYTVLKAFAMINNCIHINKQTVVSTSCFPAGDMLLLKVESLPP